MVFLGEEQDHARPPLMGDEAAQGTGSEWRSRQERGRRDFSGIQPVDSSRPPSSSQGGEGEIDTDDHSISPPPPPIMNLITATLLSALSCYTELAAAATGRVITLDPSLSSHEHSSTQQDTLSPETARLVIAQRAGLEDYHVDKALNEKEINAINAHGLQTSRLSKDNTERVFILAFVDEEDAEGTQG